MRRAVGLRVRFVVAGALLVTVTVATGGWSAWAFREVSRVVGETLRDSEQTTAATDALASALEREDDALLLTLADEARGRRELARDREAVSAAMRRVDALLNDPRERSVATELEADVDAYHSSGDGLVAIARAQEARARYHDVVNPLLRRAVVATAHIRDEHFRSTQSVAAWARDRATRSMQILAAVSAVALLLSALVALHLGRVVLVPLAEMMRAVEALRRGDFARRVTVRGSDELGRLGEGFNRMADDLAEFRRANIGEVVRAKETLEATLAALPDAVLVIEADGEVSSTNPRASVVMRAASPSTAKNLRDLAIPEAARSAALAVLQAGAAPLAGVDLAKAISLFIDNEPRKLLPRVVPIEGLPGGRRGAVLVLSDVTDLVRLDEMRLELVAVASHELRTPLTTLRMTLMMLKERAAAFEPRDRALLETALMGVEQLAVTVDEFLDLTRIESGQLRLQLERVPVGELLARSAQTIASACKEAPITLTVQVDAAAPPTVAADAARLTTVLSNLLSNAVKYTPAGGRIELRAGAAAEGPTSVQIEVIDTGSGVPAEFRERVFEKFFRVEHVRPGTDVGTRGSGIGLYVAREIVEAHGGTIRCEAGPEGRGTRLVLRLPVDGVAVERAAGGGVLDVAKAEQA